MKIFIEKHIEKFNNKQYTEAKHELCNIIQIITRCDDIYELIEGINYLQTEHFIFIQNDDALRIYQNEQYYTASLNQIDPIISVKTDLLKVTEFTNEIIK